MAEIKNNVKVSKKDIKAAGQKPTVKEGEEKYSIMLDVPVLDENGKAVQVSRGKTGLLGLLGFKDKKDYILADVLVHILGQIPANHFVSKGRGEVIEEIFDELLGLYSLSKDITKFDYKKPEELPSVQTIISSEAAKYLRPVIGGYDRVELGNKLMFLRSIKMLEETQE